MARARIRYQTFEFGETDIHVQTLRDRQQYADDQKVAEDCGVPPALWPLFGVVWESGEVLARLMHVQNIEGVRILELGCGIAMASLVLHCRGADITATDYHPEAGVFLSRNLALNSLGPLRFVRTGWSEAAADLGQYDLLIGSDLLYEEASVEALPGFINRHGADDCKVIIVDPGRGLAARFSRRMMEAGFDRDTAKPDGVPAQGFSGAVLRFSRPASLSRGR